MFTICIAIYATAFTSIPFTQECRTNQSAIQVSREINDCNRLQSTPGVMCGIVHEKGSAFFSFEVRRLWTEST